MSVLSVIIPCYNRARYLKQAVSSILEDTSEMEIVVVDDASTDDSIKSIADLPVRVLRHDKRLGPAAARNTGLGYCRGPFITFFDSDDILSPNGMRARLEWLKQHLSSLVVGGRLDSVIDGEGRELEGFSHWIDRLSSVDILTEEMMKKDCSQLPILPFWTLMFQKAIFDAVGRFDESLWVCEDIDFCCRVLKLTPIVFINAPVASYRLHSHNQSWRVQDGQFIRPDICRGTSALLRLAHFGESV